jgi:hypothetical protein
MIDAVERDPLTDPKTSAIVSHQEEGPSPRRSLSPRPFARHRILGRVYEGHHGHQTSLAQSVALKVFRKDFVALAGP